MSQHRLTTRLIHKLRGTSRVSAKRFAFGKRRRGVQVLESLLVIPICLLLVLAFVQFGATVTVHHAVLNAATETARELSKVPGFDITDPNDLDEAVEVIDEILGIHGVTLGQPGLIVIIEDSNGVACLGDAALESEFCPSQSSIVDELEIKVCVILLIDNSPVPQFLDAYCIDFSGKRYEYCSIARRDC